MNKKRILRIRRKFRIRSKITGTQQRPRLAIYRSNKAMYAQVVDDAKGITLVSARIAGINKTAAQSLGKEIAQKVAKKGITTLVFDRGGYRYHGSVAAFADAVREGGIII